MKVPLAWLVEYVPLNLPPSELAHRLTMAGVEAIYDPGASAGWEHVFVGLVTQVQPHPNAERLRLATVDVGTESVTVVCGAPNVAEGQRVAFARVGANLINPRDGERFALAAAIIRGVVSAGMVCSERELGLGDDHEGILVLADEAPVGRPLAEFIRDDVLELEVTANRGDTLSILGVAHEVAAITGEQVAEPPLDYVAEGTDINGSVQVRVDNPELCGRYLATAVRGIRVGTSPRWMQERLLLAGMRPINNVVDVTNYVMLEYGQPLHAFDLNKVRQQAIIVRAARSGEGLTTLDDQELALQPPMLVIADPERAIALAGVMGGANSEMTDATTDVLLESATFDAINTRRTAQLLKLRSEASARFEKGLHPELALRAVRRATSLILQTAGGRADEGVAEDYPRPVARQPIRLRPQRLHDLLGVDFAPEQVSQVLVSLGLEVGSSPDGTLLATPPYWRTDLSIEEDLIEEVARTIGYEAVPAAPLAGRTPVHVPQPMRLLREQVKDILVASGMQETISYSLVSQGLMDMAGRPLGGGPTGGTEPLRMANPMSQEQEYLRTTLRGSVLRNLATNLRQAFSGLGVFEAGRVYWARPEDLPDERETVFVALGGERGESLWTKGSAPLDFYDAKGVLLSLLGGLGVQARFERATDPILHPGRTARVLVDEQPIGVIGELHPQSVAAFDLPTPLVACFELDLALLLPKLPERKYGYRPFSKFPRADRDLALVVDEPVPAEQLQAIIERHPLVRRVVLFDLFSGSPLPPGKKSLAYHVELQSEQGTLSTEAVNEAMATVVRRLEQEASASLRV